MLSSIAKFQTRQSARYLVTRMSSTSAAPAEASVLFKSENLSKIISLNRPKKLNSLDTSMVSAITPRLVEYSKSDVTNLIILNSTSARAFCAGGDVATCAKLIESGESDKAVDFFQKEYSLNYLLSTYPKPIVSYINGITMGGGVGLSVHTPFRVATETTNLAMPEMDIGFFPDVGTTFFLPKLDFKLGYYYALTGQSIKGLDNLMIGTATHYVSSQKLDELTSRISNLPPNKNMANFFATVNQAIEEFVEPIPTDYKFPFTKEQLATIENAFSQKSVQDIFSYLEKDGSEFAKETLDKLSKKSLFSLNLAYESLNINSKSNINEALRYELSLATKIIQNPKENDFVEGVTSKLITKTNKPNWKYTDLSDVPEAKVREFITIDTKKATIDKFYDITYNDYPIHVGVPTAEQIKNYIIGNDGSNRKYLPTRQEVLAKFLGSTRDKVGTRFKTNLILDLKTQKSQYDNAYIEWVD